VNASLFLYQTCSHYSDNSDVILSLLLLSLLFMSLVKGDCVVSCTAVSTNEAFCFRYFSGRAIGNPGYFFTMNYAMGVPSIWGSFFENSKSLCSSANCDTAKGDARSEFGGNRLRRFRFRWMQLSSTSRMHFASPLSLSPFRRGRQPVSRILIQ